MINKIITLLILSLFLVPSCFAETGALSTKQKLIFSEKGIEDIYQNSMFSNIDKKKMGEILEHVDNTTLTRYVNNKMITSIYIDDTGGSQMVSFPVDILNNQALRSRLFRKTRVSILQNYIDGGGILSKSMFRNVFILKNDIGEFIVENKIIPEQDLIDRSLSDSIELSSNRRSTSQELFTNMVFGGLEFESRALPISIDTLSNDILFNKDDIYALFDVVSFKHRTLKNDTASRKFNVAKAYDLIGGSNGIFVLNSNETFSYHSFLKGVMNDKTFKYGAVIKGNKIVDALGGGLCGGSTGIFQGSLYNPSLTFNGRNHSQYYHTLYNSSIQGKYNKNPGLDIAYWNDEIDLKITNASIYPVILVNRLVNNVEYNFTLNYKKSNIIPAEVNYIGKKGSCYSWIINGNPFKRCYRKINP